MRQPRFKRGQWIVWKETTSICRVIRQAHSPGNYHLYAVYAPSTAVRFVGKESEFRPLNHEEMRLLKMAISEEADRKHRDRKRSIKQRRDQYEKEYGRKQDDYEPVLVSLDEIYGEVS